MQNTDDDDQPAQERPQLSGLGLAGLGLAVACCLVAGLALGWFLDDRLGTAPVFILVGMASGILLGVLGSYREMRRYLSD
jgi:F0F1-type ATP synthase assembly protein I